MAIFLQTALVSEGLVCGRIPMPQKSLHVSSSHRAGVETGKCFAKKVLIKKSGLMQIFYSNDCRFPHILPESNGFGPGRMGSKPRYPLNGVTNNVANLEGKFSQMNVQEVRDAF